MQNDLNANTESTETEIPEAPETETASEAEGAPDSSGGEDSDAGIEIDGQRFGTEAEALAFVREQNSKLAVEKAVLESYQAGLTDARGIPAQPAASPQPPEDDFNEEQFYANPKAALKEIEERAMRKAVAKIQASTQATETEKEVWENFCGLHPDLSDFKADVEATANSPKHRNIITALAQTKGQTEAMNYVAQKTRAKFNAYAAASKKATVLPKGAGAGASPSGAQKPVTLAKKEAKPLSMSDQVRQLRAKQRK